MNRALLHGLRGELPITAEVMRSFGTDYNKAASNLIIFESIEPGTIIVKDEALSTKLNRRRDLSRQRNCVISTGRSDIF